MQIAIFYQGRTQDTSEVDFHLTRMLQQQSYEVRTIDIRDEGQEAPDTSLKGCDLAVVLGGDGTILHAARICSFANIPIVGVNFGRVGFLTELEPGELETTLAYYLQNDPSVWGDKRSMLHSSTYQD